MSRRKKPSNTLSSTTLEFYGVICLFCVFISFTQGLFVFMFYGWLPILGSFALFKAARKAKKEENTESLRKTSLENFKKDQEQKRLASEQQRINKEIQARETRKASQEANERLEREARETREAERLAKEIHEAEETERRVKLAVEKAVREAQKNPRADVEQDQTELLKRQIADEQQKRRSAEAAVARAQAHAQRELNEERRKRQEAEAREQSERAARLREQNTKRSVSTPKAPHEVLGVSRNATRDEVNQAFRRLANIYHPDKLAGLSNEIQSEASEKMMEINSARDNMLRSR